MAYGPMVLDPQTVYMLQDELGHLTAVLASELQDAEVDSQVGQVALLITKGEASVVDLLLEGGIGSGYFHHAGRPGVRGGSAPGGGGGRVGSREWVDEHGATVTSLTQLSRIRHLAIPPAWTDVRVAANPKAQLQVVGRDVKGRQQYRYNGAFRGGRDAAKFKRVEKLAKVYSKLVAGAEKDMARGNEAATVVTLILHTSMRVGSVADRLADVKAYGATTLQARHVKVSGKAIDIDFIAKKGNPWDVRIEHAGLAAAITHRLAGKSGTDHVFSADAKAVNQYIGRYGRFSAKDLRTLHGTAVAKEALAKEPEPRTKTEARALVKKVAEFVAVRLHNTAAVAKSAYINPVVWAPLEVRFGMKVLKVKK